MLIFHHKYNAMIKICCEITFKTINSISVKQGEIIWPRYL